jgi:hypothetical protein
MVLTTIGYVVVAASVIVKYTSSKSDNEAIIKAKGFYGKLIKVLSYLPLFGKSPITKALEEALKEADKNLKPE